jgi:hypothetical protein
MGEGFEQIDDERDALQQADVVTRREFRQRIPGPKPTASPAWLAVPWRWARHPVGGRRVAAHLRLGRRGVPAGLAGALLTEREEQLAAWLGQPLARLWPLLVE